MFNVKHNECVGFESRWKVKKVSLVQSTQTSEYITTEMETNTTETRDCEVQVETETENTASKIEVDEDKLAEWLNRIYPSVKKELDNVANSKAFKGYRLLTDSSDATCKLVQTVNVSSQLKEADIGCHVSALSWNSTNKTLAVSCIYKHKSWCYHEGFVAFYTLNNDDFLPEMPKMKLKVDSCVLVLQFHPVFPAVIAGGLFSGEIIIWNIQNEEDEVVVKVVVHNDGISQLSWISDINAPKNFLLASSSLDGFLSLWDFNLVEQFLVLKERHQIKSKLLPSQSEEAAKKIVKGIICFDFSKHSPEMFVVGGEGGLVVECSLLGTTKVKGSSTSDVPLLNSAFKYYQPHKGEIISVSYSPNRKDMFMTSGTDGEVRIYMIGQEEPAQMIFLKNSLNCIIWIPYEEKIIAGCGPSGIIEIFDVVKGKVFENTVKEKIKSHVLTRIEINKMKTSIVAVGSEDGHIHMWRVPWTLFGKLV